MLTRPDDLTDAVLLDALSKKWRLAVASLEYRAVGFGSHHWVADDVGGRRWFLTADELASSGTSSDDERRTFGHLAAALGTARRLKDSGAAFVVAPVPAGDGEILHQVRERFALALYPYIEGRCHVWGEYQSAPDRLEVLGLIVAVHASPGEVTRDTLLDDFRIPHRDELVRALGDLARPWRGGPFAEPGRSLLARHADGVGQLLGQYDRRVDDARARGERFVLTHGEPHVANLIRSESGWMLVDWDTAMMAPPERDLGLLDSGDGQVLGAYAEATGTAVSSSLIDLYRIRWDLADLAIYVTQFRGPHAETEDDQESWKNLNTVLDRVRGRSTPA